MIEIIQKKIDIKVLEEIKGKTCNFWYNCKL